MLARLRRTFGAVSLLLIAVVTVPDALAQSMFSHQVPIKLPKGTNGMQPELALVYTPGAGNGILGVGWGLTGLPSISRVAYGDGIRFAGGDTYAHSELGVLVKQADGNYRTRTESFVKLVPSGVCGDGPCSWTALYPSGGKAYFGTTTDSRLLKQGSASAKTWGVARVQDLFNNAYEVAYSLDGPNGQIYPSVVTYTKAPNTTTYRTVEFGYEARPDTEPGYYQGTSFQSTNARLTSIAVKSAGRLVRRYVVGYECPASAGTNCSIRSPTNRSRVRSVTEYGSDGATSLPSQVFTWQGSSPATSFGPQLSGFSPRDQLGDFDGDGRTDLLRILADRADVSFGDGAGNFTTRSGFSITYGNLSGITILAGDFDGDGRSDIVDVTAGTGIGTVRFARATGFVGAYPHQFSFTSGYQGVFVGDFDGDGRSDLLASYSDHAEVLVGNGDGSFRSSRIYTVTGSFLAPVLADFDGDGRTDVAALTAWTVMPTLFFSEGDGTFSPGPSLPFSTNEPTLTPGDFNGDGKTDFVASAPAGWLPGIYQPSLSVFINNGNGTFQTNSILYGDVNVTDPVSVADVNGDGKTDIIFAGAVFLMDGSPPSGEVVFLKDGSHFRIWADPNAIGAFLANYGSKNVISADFDGDARTDYFLFDSSGICRVMFTAGEAPDLLKTIQNGTGGTITAEYKPATQIPGAIDWASTAPGVPLNAPQPLAVRVTTADGRGGTWSTSYGYGDARHAPGLAPERRNLGFRWIFSQDEQTRQSTTTFFNQTAGCEGHVSQIDSKDGFKFVTSRKTFAYSLVSPGSGTELCLETSQTAQSYELRVAGFSQTTTTYYDTYANPVTKTQAATGLPTLVITAQFSNDPAGWVLGRLLGAKTTTGTTTLGEFRNQWTGNTLTAKGEWLDPSVWVTTVMTYDANGNVATVTSPPTGDGLVRRTTTAYDATFHAYPAKVTNALGHVTTSVYNDHGLLASSTDVNGNVTTTTYDALWRKLKETRPDGGTTDYTYPNFGNTTGYPAGQYLGTVTTLSPGRTVFRHEYFDGAGFNFMTVTTGNCSVGAYVQTTRDSAGRPAVSTLPRCIGLGIPRSTATAFDARSRVSSVTTPDGKVTQYAYGNSFRRVTDPNGQITTRYFDARDRVTSVVDAAGQTTTYAYDALGRLTSTTLPNGDVTRQTWDSLNRKKTTEVRLAASKAPITTTNTYDAVGNVKTTCTAGKCVTFTYDALNRVIIRQPNLETAATFQYDEPWSANGKGRLTTRIDDAGIAKFGYAWTGQVKAFTQTIDGKNLSQSFAFDLAGRMTRLTYPDGSYADYTYTDGGEHATAKLFVNGALAAGATWAGFNAGGKPGTVTYGNTVATSYSYDAMNHMTALVTVRGTAQIQNLTYDWYGGTNTGGLNLASITDNRPAASRLAPDGTNTDDSQVYTYDALYRLTKAIGVWGVKSFAFDPVGNATTFGGSVARSFTYDGLQVASGTGFSAQYDTTGNMTQRNLDGTAWSYTWSVDNRLKTASKNGALTADMVYAVDGQRVKKVYHPATGPTVTTTYSGNVYEKRTYSDNRAELHTIHLYANGQLVASVTRSGNLATAFNNPTEWRSQLAMASLYDGASMAGGLRKAGHFLTAAASHPLTVRWVPLLAFAALAALLVIVFVRSLLRARAERPTLAPRVRLAALALVVGFTFTACFNAPLEGIGRSGDALIVGDTTTGLLTGTYYYHRNHVNSASVVTNASGAETTRMVYLPYGEISQANSTGQEAVSSKYTGQEFDAETGLYYYGARYYDPAIGRFVSADTIVPNASDAQAFNRYSYARGNPIIYTDPTGHSFWSVLGDIFTGIGNAMGRALGAVGRAARWVWSRCVDAAMFVYRGHVFSLQIAKAMVLASRENPLAALGIILAIAAGPPGWVGLAVAIAAQGMAMAAGIRDPRVLGLIGVVAGAAAGGWTAMAIGSAKYGAEEALVAAGCPPQLAAACSIMLNLAAANAESNTSETSPGGFMDLESQTWENGDFSVSACSAELRARPVDDWRARTVGAQHSFWTATDSSGSQWVVSGGPSDGHLNVWVSGDVVGGVDNVSAPATFSTGSSPANCAGVDGLLSAARQFPNGEIAYSVRGPNSNSAARYLGAVAGFRPPRPQGAIGWYAPVPAP